MNEFLVTERMVSEKIRKLDITKSAGPDNINARVLKELHDVIIEPWTLLFNNSLNQGMVPRRTPMWQQSGTLQFCSCHGIAGFLVDELEI